MVGGIDLQLTTSRIGNFYNTSLKSLAGSMERLSSGKKYNQPKDGVLEYFRVKRMQQDRSDYRVVQENLDEGHSMMKVAETTGMSIVDTVKRMKTLVRDYWENPNDADAQAAAKAEFEGLKSGMQDILNANYYQSVDLNTAGTVASIRIDPNDINNTMDLTFDAGDIVDPTSLTIDAVDETTSMATIDDAYGKSLSYLSKVSAYMRSIDSQSSINSSQIENSQEFEDTLNGVDEVEEMSKMTEHDIRQQAALSMISQGNMYQMSILKLIQ